MIGVRGALNLAAVLAVVVAFGLIVAKNIPRPPAPRRIADLAPELIAFLIEHMPWHVAPQFAVEWSTGARGSRVLMGCRLCDLSLAEGREQITFIVTKITGPLPPRFIGGRRYGP